MAIYTTGTSTNLISTNTASGISGLHKLAGLMGRQAVAQFRQDSPQDVFPWGTDTVSVTGTSSEI